MNKKFGACCAIARKSAGFSQEAVAELCGVSVRSISDYETGRTSVPDDIAAKMVKIYDAMWLGYLYRECGEYVVWLDNEIRKGTKRARCTMKVAAK